MPPITKVTDQPVLVPTKDFPFAKWEFEFFNPVQSRVFEFYDKESNGLIASSTSSGKTIAAEIVISHAIRKNKGKALYLVPLRSLAQEKIDDWLDKSHHFSDLKISVCTSDYKLTKDRLKELNEADLIIMTSELLSHRCRSHKSEGNEFLTKIKALVIDEGHLISTLDRGPHLEVGLMKFTEINPECRLVLLSATMPNSAEIAEWVSYVLTKNNTFCLESSYRPCPLNLHYESYADDMKKYDLVEEEKVNKAMDIIEYYPDDKFIVFSHTKRTGEMLKNNLRKIGILAEFHNAGLDKKERVSLENRFRTDPKLRVVIATSTLAAGLNMPARRVIILGVHRGLTEVDNMDCIQMAGRAGRPKYDKCGDAYFLLPESNFESFKAKLKVPQRIESKLLSTVGENNKALAFHLVSEIYHGDIETTEDVHRWYKRSLAYFQNKALEETVADKTLELLRKCGAIQQENDKWVSRPIGKVSSLFYYSPFDVSDLYFNIKGLFEQHQEENEYHLSMALGNTDTQRMGIVSRAEKEEMSSYLNKIRGMMGGKFYNDASCKAGFCYFNLLNGITPQICGAMQRNLQFDFNRLSQVLLALDSLAGSGEHQGWLKVLEKRIASGVPAHLIDLCRIANIGKVRATKLYNAGIKTVEELADYSAKGKLSKMINLSEAKVQEILTEATKLAMT